MPFGEFQHKPLPSEQTERWLESALVPTTRSRSMKTSTYSFCNAINGILSGRPSGLEAETHQELARTTKAMSGGFLVPLSVLATKAQIATTASAGGFTVGAENVAVIDALRPATIALQLGAQMVDMASNATVPRIETGSTAFWLGETEACPESNTSLSALNLVPHRCAAWLTVSNQLLAQAPVADPIFKRDLRRAVGGALDFAVFSGIGGAEPLGLLNNPKVPKLPFSGAASRAVLTDFEGALGDANADDLSASWVTSPHSRKAWRRTLNATTEGGAGYLWSDDNKVLGRSARASNNILGDLVLLGDFSDLLIVNWGVLEISDHFSRARSAQTQLLFQLHADAGPVRVQSFIASSNSGAQALT